MSPRAGQRSLGADGATVCNAPDQPEASTARVCSSLATDGVQVLRAATRTRLPREYSATQDTASRLSEHTAEFSKGS